MSSIYDRNEIESHRSGEHQNPWDEEIADEEEQDAEALIAQLWGDDGLA